MIDERREGVWGMSPQRAEVKFKCASVDDVSNSDVKAGSREVKLSELKSLYQKGLLTKEKYDE